MKKKKQEVISLNLEDADQKQREFYIFTMVLTPSVLMALLNFMPDIFYRLASQAILLFLQGVILKGIVDNR